MTKKLFLFLVLSLIILTSCAKQDNPYTNEVRSKPVMARSGQNFSPYALYNPEITASAGIEAEDVDYATGIFELINPTIDKLEKLTANENVMLYYNQTGQIIIEIKGK